MSLYVQQSTESGGWTFMLGLYQCCESCDRLLPDQQRDWHDGSIPHHEPVPVHPAVPWHHQPGCRGAVCRGRHLCPAPLHWVLPGQHVDGQVEAHTVTSSEVLLLQRKAQELELVLFLSSVPWEKFWPLCCRKDCAAHWDWIHWRWPDPWDQFYQERSGLLSC